VNAYLVNAYLVNAYSTGPEQKQTKQETKVMVKQGDSFGALLSLAGGSFSLSYVLIILFQYYWMVVRNRNLVSLCFSFLPRPGQKLWRA
jgi:hypothetical protein